MEEIMRELLEILQDAPKEVATKAIEQATAFSQGFLAGAAARPVPAPDPDPEQDHDKKTA